MAEFSNLTYNVTVNDCVLSFIKEEIASLRATLLAQEAKLECQAEKFGKELGEHVAAKYKKMLAEQEAVDHARAIDESWSLKLKRNSRGELFCCGMVVEDAPLKTLDEYTGEWKAIISEATLMHPQPFIVQQGQVYINQSTIKEATIQSDNYKEASNGWKLGKNGELELNTKTSKVVIENEVLELFDKNGTLRVRVQL